MNILFVSGELIGSALLHQFKKEGHDIRLHIDDADRAPCLDGMIVKTPNWKDELEWVGKDGLIVFDDVIFEGKQDELRAQGYRVVGGGQGGDQLENERAFGQSMFKKYGMKVLPSYDFPDAQAAIEFVKENRRKWVIKQDGHISMYNYVGHDSNAEDVISVLKTYAEKNLKPVHLQEFVDGIEVGVARYFNGQDWVGPVEINFEHKHLHNGNIGPMTGEMGTLMWYEDNDEQPLFKETIGRLTEYLREIDYRGDFDIGCMVNVDGVWPLECTARFGTPSTELQCELHQSPWGEFLGAVADGEQYDLNFKAGYGVVVSIAVPPNPYPPVAREEDELFSMKGTRIHFKRELSPEEMERLHFEEVSCGEDESGKYYYLSGRHGFALYVTGSGDTIEEARQDAYNLIDAFIIPKMFYRTDIGQQVDQWQRDKLIEWGWLPS